MKNFFSNIIKKVKNFVANLTPATKIRYIVISVVTVAVATSLLITVSLNTNEPEAPTNPEDFATGETATIDFDNEMIFDVSGTSSDSTAIEGTESSFETSDESSNITTDDDTSSKETSAEPDESTSEDEPQPTDPSQTNNDDPEPVITTPTQITNDPQTTPKPTATTTKTPQTEPKPTETTTKTPQTEPKPTETTTKAPQTEPKPTETTTKAPQTEPKPTETQPQEDPPQQSGQFSVKEKKYDYNGANVSILQVENKSEQAYTITITGKFKDSSGKVVKTESKTFEGFPAGWSNYFIFQPGVKYSSTSWGIETTVFTGETLADDISWKNGVKITTASGFSDGSGKFIYPSAEHPFETLTRCVSVFADFYNIVNDYPAPIFFACDTVVFDSDGKICFIHTSGNTKIEASSNYSISIPMFVTNVLWENKEQYTLPNNYRNVSGIVGYNSIILY